MRPSKSVTLIDYGAGNLLNVQRAFEHCGAKVTVAVNADDIANADRLVFPGVGAFPEAMQQLEAQGLIEVIKTSALNKPFIGICLGMQMMLTQSHEFGMTQGLDLLNGDVKPLPLSGIDGQTMVIPHIGWEKIQSTNIDWHLSAFTEIPNENAFYFVHSYYADVADKSQQLATFDFGGHAITAAVQKDNMMGFQFPPEKSGEMGLKIIQSFLDI